MAIDIVSVHLALALAMFFALNWVGRLAETSGYLTLDIFLQRDETPAFNFLFRVFGPVVFVILAACLLYIANLDRYVYQIWLVIFYHFVGRLMFNLGFGRLVLMNWRREALLIGTSTGFGWLLYEHVIQTKENLFPDFTHISNHLWVLIALFVYATLNNLRFSQEATRRRKSRYRYVAYSDNKLQYNEVIGQIAPDRLAESIICAILIYEGFNRPRLARVLERLMFPWKSKSLGPMQVAVGRRVSDEDSVRLGSKKVVEAYRDAIVSGNQKANEKSRAFDPLKNENHRLYVVLRVAAAYNKDDSYASEIGKLHNLICKEFYREFSPPSAPRYSDYLI